ncbi:Syntaxin SNARE domain [Trypanosoma vivax]|uniref:Putative target SNARE n=1 Tax=Trypanosoma vivax (strain Y486) TaxID=1055687 RepID=G0UBY3_TRYVY|nr:putative target SNARE [Trypanosoma vivax]KAH8609546.1 Syntaxin SNARE domain [Trypanosoma vivax]CCC53331.1 putative target SNARE [Trypanosoma vivax Y486]
MDRILQFHAASGLVLTSAVPAPGTSSPETVGPVSLHVPQEPTEQEKEATELLATFFGVVEDALVAIERVVALTRDIAAKQVEVEATVDTVKCSSIRKEIEELTNRVNEASRQACKGLEDMKLQNEKLKVSEEMESCFVGVIRIEENQRRFVAQKLMSAMEGFQKQQKAAEDQYLAQTERQIKIAYTNPDGSTLDDTTAKQLTMQVLENSATSVIFQQSKDVLVQMIETRNDVYRIEMAMRTLHQTFNDLAVLVEEQGELLNSVAQNVGSSRKYVDVGRAELKKARQYQQGSRRKLYCLLIIAGVIVGLFAVAGLLGGLL